jgi:Ca-activated chloride channel family protein
VVVGLVLALALVVASPGVASAGGPTLTVSVGHPVTAADRVTTTWLKVALTGQAPDGGRGRTPVNVAFVIDRSGSMSGDKIREARNAALAALDHLGPQDIVSVVIYDHVVDVLVPATKLTDRGAVERAIRGIATRGDTALFAGVARGAAEVRKFAGSGYVNRVVLLSDGLANVGPSTPGALGDLGASLGREGVGVTTIGLGAGYNEDLMTVLARRSDGTHYFAERASDLATVFRYELGDLTSVAAQDLRVRVECADGVRPLRALGLDAWLSGRVVTATMNQLYAGQERFVLIEVEVPARGADGSFDVARAEVTYREPHDGRTATLTASVGVRACGDAAEVARAEDGRVLADATLLLATERARQAVLLRDEGRVEEARRLLIDNVRELEDGATRWNAPKLKAYKAKNQADADGVDNSGSWNVQRKSMRRDENYYELQQMH